MSLHHEESYAICSCSFALTPCCSFPLVACKSLGTWETSRRDVPTSPGNPLQSAPALLLSRPAALFPSWPVNHWAPGKHPEGMSLHPREILCSLLLLSCSLLLYFFTSLLLYFFHSPKNHYLCKNESRRFVGYMDMSRIN